MPKSFSGNRVIILWLCTCLICVCLILLPLEILYRLITKQNYSANKNNQYRFYQYDSLLGWKGAPNVSDVFRREEFEYVVKHNKYGMRQGDVNLHKGKKFRIAVLGDSFVWGIGVPDELRFTEILQAKLSDNVEILNFGVSGYSPIQYKLMIDNVLEFEPDVILLVFCFSNDFVDNVLFYRYGYFKPYAELSKKDGLIVSSKKIPDVRRFRNQLTGQDNFWGFKIIPFLFSRIFSTKIAMKQDGLIGFDNELIYIEDEQLTPMQVQLKHKAILINKLILGDIYKKVYGRSRLVVIGAPTKREYNSKGLSEQDGLYTFAEDTLRETSSSVGIEFIDSVQAMSASDFWKTDGHWNSLGHKHFADILFRSKKVLLK